MHGRHPCRGGRRGRWTRVAAHSGRAAKPFEGSTFPDHRRRRAELLDAASERVGSADQAMHLLADHADAHVKRLARSGRYLHGGTSRRAAPSGRRDPGYASPVHQLRRRRPDGAVAPIRIVLFILPLPFGVSHTRFALVVIPSGHAGSVDCYLGATRPWRGTRMVFAITRPARPCRERNDAPSGAQGC